MRAHVDAPQHRSWRTSAPPRPRPKPLHQQSCWQRPMTEEVQVAGYALSGSFIRLSWSRNASLERSVADINAGVGERFWCAKPSSARSAFKEPNGWNVQYAERTGTPGSQSIPTCILEVLTEGVLIMEMLMGLLPIAGAVIAVYVLFLR